MKSSLITNRLHVLMIMVMLDVMSINFIIPYLPEIAYDYDFSGLRDKDFFYASLIGLWSVGGALSSHVVGGLSDYIGRKKTIVRGMFGLGCCYLVITTGLAMASWPLILLGRFGCGIFSGIYNVIEAGVYDLSPSFEQRQENLPKVHIAASAGEMLGPLLVYLFGDVLSDFSLGRYIPSFAGGIFCFINSAMSSLYLALPDDKEAKKFTSFQEVNEQAMKILYDKDINYLLAIYFFNMLALNGALETVPAFLCEALLLSPPKIALLTGQFGVGCLMYNRFINDPLKEKNFNNIGLIIFSGVLMSLSLAVSSLMVHYQWSNEILIGCNFFIQGLLQSCFYLSLVESLAKVINSDNNGKSMGIMGSLYSLAFLVNSVFYANYAAYSKAVPMLLACFAMIIAVVIQIIKNREYQHERQIKNN